MNCAGGLRSGIDLRCLPSVFCLAASDSGFGQARAWNSLASLDRHVGSHRKRVENNGKLMTGFRNPATPAARTMRVPFPFWPFWNSTGTAEAGSTGLSEIYSLPMRTTLAICAVLFCAVPVCSQTPDQIESPIAQLPQDQRTYERFRYWVTTQPVEGQRSSDLMQKYRAYLKGQGLAEPDIDSQIKQVTDRGTDLEVQRWNRILTAEKPLFNTKPNAFLVEMVKTRKPGAALDVGMGQGRNAIWLAQEGWTVTGFDPADKAVALANQTAQRLGLHLNTEITTAEKFDFGANRWDLILLSYFGARGMTQQLQKALKPHGILVVEAFHRDATKGSSIGGAVVFDPGELVNLFPDLRVVRYEEPMAIADFGLQQVRVVRLCAEKQE